MPHPAAGAAAEGGRPRRVGDRPAGRGVVLCRCRPPGAFPDEAYEGEGAMEYVVTWQEQPTGSDAECRAAQQRVLAAFVVGEEPESLTIHRFVAWVGLG